MRRPFLLMALPLFMAPAAGAATFVQTPPERVTSAMAPYLFSWAPDSTAAGGNATAWKRSDETAWHRCAPGSRNVTIDSLPQGKFTFDIADDLNFDYYASTGHVYDGFLSPCRESPPPPPASAIRRFTMTVDDTPPAAPAPPVVPAPQPPAPAPMPTVTVTTPAPPPAAAPPESDCSRSRRLVLVTHAKTVIAKRAFKRRATKKRKAAYRKAQRVELAARRLRNLDCE